MYESKLRSKQRASLRGAAMKLDPILHIGKGGVIDTVVKQADDVLTARELIKIKVLETCEYDARETADMLSDTLQGEVIQVIGSRIVLYRRNPEKGQYDDYL